MTKCEKNVQFNILAIINPIAINLSMRISLILLSK